MPGEPWLHAAYLVGLCACAVVAAVYRDRTQWTRLALVGGPVLAATLALGWLQLPMTPSVAWELVRRGHLVRSLRLAPFGPAAVAVVALLVARRGGTDDVIGDLRMLGLLLALGSGYVLDDGAAVTLQASPYSLARRLWLRIGCAAAIVAPLWTVMLARLLPSAPASDRWALGLGLTVELAAALAVVWAVAAWGRRRGVEHPGIITTPVLLASLLLAASISPGADAGRTWSTVDSSSPAMVGHPGRRDLCAPGRNARPGRALALDGPPQRSSETTPLTKPAGPLANCSSSGFGELFEFGLW